MATPRNDNARLHAVLVVAGMVAYRGTDGVPAVSAHTNVIYKAISFGEDHG